MLSCSSPRNFALALFMDFDLGLIFAVRSLETSYAAAKVLTIMASYHAYLQHADERPCLAWTSILRLQLMKEVWRH